MERQEILEAMDELKLYGMRASFDEVAGKGLTRRAEIYPLLASLIRAERTHRQARSISYRISAAKFPVLKDIDSFVFADTPVDEGQVRELATGAFLDAKRNGIFIGGTGTGKTHLCIGVASAVVRARARGRFFNLVDLVNQLEQEKAAGRSGRLAEKLLRYDLIVIDELGYLPFSQPGGQLLFHLISKLYAAAENPPPDPLPVLPTWVHRGDLRWGRPVDYVDKPTPSPTTQRGHYWTRNGGHDWKRIDIRGGDAADRQRCKVDLG